MDVFIAFSILIITPFILYISSHFLVDAVKKIGRKSSLEKLFLGVIFAGVATSIPELFIAISASFDKEPQIAVGNALGSNIADLALILPLIVFITGKSINTHKGKLDLRTTFLLFTSSLFPFLLATDGTISRIEGLFLIAVFFIYTFYIFQNKLDGLSREIKTFFKKVKDGISHPYSFNSFATLILALIALVLSSEALIRATTFISLKLQINIFFLGVFLIAAGTSIPELFVGVSSIKENENSILFGDIFGSLITNANLIIGIAALISPITFSDFSEYFVSVFFLFLTFSLFILFAHTKNKIEKWEATILLASYFLFIILETMI